MDFCKLQKLLVYNFIIVKIKDGEGTSTAIAQLEEEKVLKLAFLIACAIAFWYFLLRKTCRRNWTQPYSLLNRIMPNMMTKLQT